MFKEITSFEQLNVSNSNLATLIWPGCKYSDKLIELQVENIKYR